MKKIDFLFKPMFFICSLFFATWMTLKIEQLQPSDFSRYTRLFENEREIQERKRQILGTRKQGFKQLYLQYRTGKIDSLKFEKELEEMLKEMN
jgi:hypothetical protein